MRYASLAQGGLYAVVGDDEHILDTLVIQAIVSCAPGMTAMLLTSRPIASMLAINTGACKAFRDAARRGNIALMAHARDAASPLAFVEGVISDLAYFGGIDGMFIVIDGAECLFEASSNQDQHVLGRLRNWIEDSGAICLLVCRSSKALPRFLDASRRLAGLASLQMAAGQMTLAFFHWFTSSGMAGAHAFEIELGSDSVLALMEEQSPATQAQEPASDENDVIVARPAIQSTELAPVSWTICDDVPSLLLRASDCVAATIVLPFTGSAGFDRLAKAVHTLRTHCGNHIKIVVREINIQLRYSQEALIMRLGANMVIPAEVGFARLRNLLLVVQRQVFAHRVPRSFEQAMLESAPELEQGYLMPSAFVQAALTVLNASQRLGLQDVLVRLPLGYGLQPIDALCYCAIRREGDLCTADDAHVYILLHACRESNIALTLESLFKLPIGELFTSETNYMSPDQIKMALADLQSRHAVRGFTDLSADLASIRHAEGVSHIKAAPTPAQAFTRPQEIKYAAPAPAQRRPLGTRSVLALVEVETQ